METGNADAEAAAELANLGIKPGDNVARISPNVTALGIERILRVEVVAEVALAIRSDFGPLNHTFKAPYCNFLHLAER
jgi:hypothetical protein